MLMPLRVACALGLFALAAAAGAQQTITVGPSGTYQFIQDGVNAANAGDTVQVQPGTYLENVTINKAITLTSLACAGTSPAAGCNGQTIIDGSAGGGTGSDVTVTNVFSLKTVVSGFSLVNANSNKTGDPAGVELDNSGATIKNNVFSGNSAVLLMNSGAVAFLGNTVSTATSVGTSCRSENGLYLTGTNTLVLDSTGAVAGTTILGNTISGTAKCLGGVGINDLQGNPIYIGFNTISGQSLAISVSSSNAATYIYDNVISGNSLGGIDFNHATTNPPSGPADSFVLNNTFVNNLSGAKGLSGAAGPAEIYVTGTSGKIELVNNIFSTNSATNPVLDCAGLPSSTTNQITPLVMDHNLFYNSATNGKLGTNACPVTVGSYGNLNANPNFVSSTNFQLVAGSPAIDSGNNSFTTILPYVTDLAGTARVVNYTSSLQGPVVDMGAYEAVPLNGLAAGSNQFSRIAAASSSYFLVSGNSFTLSANLGHTVDGINFTPTGNATVVFTGTGGVLPVAVVTDGSGNASVPYTLATPGLYAFTVTYSGGAYFPATSIVLYVYVENPLAVTTIGLSSSKNASLVGQSVTFTVTSTATDGSHPSPVVLADNGTTLATLTPTSGTATYVTSTLAQGSHPLTATFAGDATHTSGSAGLTQLVGNYTTTTTTVSSTVNPSVLNQSVTLTAHVAAASGVATGTVTFTDGATQLGSVVTVDGSGNATYTTAGFAVGSHLIAANYTATGTYASSSGTLTQVVNADPTQSVLTVSPSPVVYGTTLKLTATVTAPSPATGLPTGTVTFYDGSVVLGTATLNSGVSVLSIPSLSAGAHSLGCFYSGATTLAASTCSAVNLTVTQAATSVVVTSSANPSPALTPITFTVTPSNGGQALAAGAAVSLVITPAGGGGATYPLTTGATGSATYTSPGLAAGTYAVAASYAATTNYSGSVASLGEVVTVNATGIALVGAPNPGIQNNVETFAAVVSASVGASPPSGTVTFMDGATLLSTVAFSATNGTTSTATLQTSALTAGQHTIFASYTPSVASFAASGPATLALTIAPQDFTFTAGSPSITIQTEHHASMPLTLTSVGGFAAQVSLSCGANLPPYLTCTLPASVGLGANGSANVTLALETDALPGYVSWARPPGGPGGLVFAALLPLGLLGLLRGKRRARVWVALVAFAAVVGSLGGCSGKYPGHTPPGTYSIPITAVGSAPGSTAPVTHTVVVTLVVTQ